MKVESCTTGRASTDTARAAGGCNVGVDCVVVSTVSCAGERGAHRTSIIPLQAREHRWLHLLPLSISMPMSLSLMR